MANPEGFTHELERSDECLARIGTRSKPLPWINKEPRNE